MLQKRARNNSKINKSLSASVKVIQNRNNTPMRLAIIDTNNNSEHALNQPVFTPKKHFTACCFSLTSADPSLHPGRIMQ